MERIELSRDVQAVQIPAGHTTLLERGTEAYITQSLGGSYTLQVPEYGGLFRIAGRDGDAIGKEVIEEAIVAEGDLEAQVWTALKTCYDPEIPVNIVDLGLVYSMEITPGDPGNRVDVKMTLTAPGCGMGDFLRQDVQQKLLAIPGVAAADVEVVLDPPWDQSMMSDAARLQLGLM